MKSASVTHMVFTTVVFLICQIVLTGCTTKNLPPLPSEKASLSPRETEKKPESTVELMPEESGFISRTVIKGLSGKPIELQFKYKDGDTGIHYLDEATGNIKECKELFADMTTVKSRAVFDKDGKTLVKGELYRPDGTLRLTKTRLPSGYYELSRYLPNNKHPFLTEAKISDEELQRQVFRDDGTILAKVQVKYFSRTGYGVRLSPTAEIMTSIYFRADGSKDFTVQYFEEGDLPGLFQPKVSWYRQDGTLSHIQTWTSRVFDNMSRLEEFEADGKTLKRDTGLRNEYQEEIPDAIRIVPESTIYFKNGEKVLYRELRYAPGIAVLEPVDPVFRAGMPDMQRVLANNCAVESESTFEHGKSKNVENPADESVIAESFNPEMFKFPRNRQLDNNSLRILGESSSYFGPVIGNDPCRYWYNHLD